ncbi:MAG TPA: hypothetical protein DHV35_06115 [Halieaceae bacterium]|nr:hypothetical protein [Halieaceae bacterium]
MIDNGYIALYPSTPLSLRCDLATQWVNAIRTKRLNLNAENLPSLESAVITRPVHAVDVMRPVARRLCAESKRGRPKNDHEPDS